MSKHILIIDDDQILNEMITELLRLQNYTTVSAFNGQEGLECLQNGQFDLVITDIIMPDKEGLQTIREIRQLHEDLPIIAISGGGKHNADYLSMAGLMGAAATFKKPFNHKEFLDAITNAIG